MKSYRDQITRKTSKGNISPFLQVWDMEASPPIFMVGIVLVTKTIFAKEKTSQDQYCKFLTGAHIETFYFSALTL
jgi:hypothetical protein